MYFYRLILVTDTNSYLIDFWPSWSTSPVRGQEREIKWLWNTISPWFHSVDVPNGERVSQREIKGATVNLTDQRRFSPSNDHVDNGIKEKHPKDPSHVEVIIGRERLKQVAKLETD